MIPKAANRVQPRFDMYVSLGSVYGPIIGVVTDALSRSRTSYVALAQDVATGNDNCFAGHESRGSCTC